MTDAAVATTDATQTVADNVRAELGRAGMTQGELATALGLTPMFVSRRLSGDVAMSPNDIELFAGFFGVDVADLFKRHQRRATAGVGMKRSIYLLEVGPAGFEPTTSTVDERELAPVTPLFGRAS